MLLSDIHCHILPDVDDGARNGKMTMDMLKSAYKQGVRRMIVTPHYRRGMFEIPLDIIESKYSEAGYNKTLSKTQKELSNLESSF